MKSLTTDVLKFLGDEQGSESLEWALVCGVIVLAGSAVFQSIRTTLAGFWTATNASVNDAATGLP